MVPCPDGLASPLWGNSDFLDLARERDSYHGMPYMRRSYEGSAGGGLKCSFWYILRLFAESQKMDSPRPPRRTLGGVTKGVTEGVLRLSKVFERDLHHRIYVT